MTSNSGRGLLFVESVALHVRFGGPRSPISARRPSRLQVCGKSAAGGHSWITTTMTRDEETKGMDIRMFVVNAFTGPEGKKLGTGNPAAVALLTDTQDAELSDEQRQELAAEMNLSETAFVVRVAGSGASDNRFKIRWFTPAVEVDLCGHATLAAARAVLDDGWVSNGDILFETTAKGTLRVEAGDEELTMEFPELSRREELEEAEKEALCIGLGEKVEECFRSDYDIVARVADRATVEGMEVCLQKVREMDTRGIIVASEGEGTVRFVSRFFAPRVGIEEDPVTGSAHCVLARMFLASGETGVEALQLSRRGGWLKVGRPREGVVTIGGRTRVVWKGSAFL